MQALESANWLQERKLVEERFSKSAQKQEMLKEYGAGFYVRQVLEAMVGERIHPMTRQYAKRQALREEIAASCFTEEELND